MADIRTPISGEEQQLARLAGEDVTPRKPQSAVEMWLQVIYDQGGTGGGGGEPGADGITPTVTITDITGGHNVAFSYGAGDPRNTNFNVMDGEDGATGATGPQGPQGIQGPAGDSIFNTGTGYDRLGEFVVNGNMTFTESDEGYVRLNEIWQNYQVHVSYLVSGYPYDEYISVYQNGDTYGIQNTYFTYENLPDGTAVFTDNTYGSMMGQPFTFLSSFPVDVANTLYKLQGVTAMEPSQDSEIATKKYVDDNAGGSGDSVFTVKEAGGETYVCIDVEPGAYYTYPDGDKNNVRLLDIMDATGCVLVKYTKNGDNIEELVEVRHAGNYPDNDWPENYADIFSQWNYQYTSSEDKTAWYSDLSSGMITHFEICSTESGTYATTEYELKGVTAEKPSQDNEIATKAYVDDLVSRLAAAAGVSI